MFLNMPQNLGFNLILLLCLGEPHQESLLGESIYFLVEVLVLIHNLNTTSHFTGVTPTVTNNDDAAAIGTIYVTPGLNFDMVYATGGPTASGFPFMWAVMV